MSVLTLPIAKQHLNVVHDEDDDKIDRCIDFAEAALIDYLKVTSIDDVYVGSPAVFPSHIYAALILMTEAFYENQDPITPAVASLLLRSRDPALA